ncbi:MAG: polysaccharide biosynthesis tyrosine autokinase, partial [Gemmatimonadales bacterium]
LQRRVDGTARDLREIPQRALEEQRLRRALLLAENLYTTLRTRYEEARVAEASSIPDVRILDAAAVPREPLRDPAPRLIALAFLGSLAIAVVGAVLIDRLDPRVRYPEQVSQELGLPIIGAVPHLPAGAAAGPLSPDKVHEVVEAFRAISLGVHHTYGSGPIVLSVTSPGLGDGKSFVSANLALAFASSGYRTLLIDADLRRGAVHRRVGAQRKPGLADYLQGAVAREWLVQTTSYSSLWFIGCGGRTSAASQLLAKGGMAEYLGELRHHYDVILVDCPPLGAAVDPFILSTLTGNVLVVLRTGTSHRALAAAKLEALRRLPVRLLGAVLNDVPPVSVYRYYAYYLPGYEGPAEPQRAKLPRVV